MQQQVVIGRRRCDLICSEDVQGTLEVDYTTNDEILGEGGPLVGNQGIYSETSVAQKKNF